MFQLLVPGFFAAEVDNVLRKRWCRGELSAEDVSTTLDALDLVPLRVHPTRVLLPRAIEIATVHGRSVYDSPYLAPSVEESACMITADRKLFDAVAGGPLGLHTSSGLSTTLRRSRWPRPIPPRPLRYRRRGRVDTRPHGGQLPPTRPSPLPPSADIH